MKFKKPNFWDYKEPNFIAYFLLPFSWLLLLINFLKNKDQIKAQNIKTICVGNIYIGGTGKTPISIEINRMLNNLNYKTGFVKKNYYDQLDEQKLLLSAGKLFCEKNRIDALKKALDKKIDVAIFDDGLQDKRINYDISFVCFNIKNWIGNGLSLPSGPLRENLKNLKKYDAVFLNGNGEEMLPIQKILKEVNPNIKIFVGRYLPLNVEEIDQDQNYVAFSGIGNPESFTETLLKNKFKIVKKINFPDHYFYSDLEITKIKETAKNLNAKVITTEKDYNRLNELNSENIECLKIELKIVNENELINFLNNKL